MSAMLENYNTQNSLPSDACTVTVHFTRVWTTTCLGMSPSEYGPSSEATNECVCPGDTLTYYCTVMGTPGGFTVWTGSAFDCTGGEIILRHSAFLTAVGLCNNGAIVARGIGVEGNNYTSQLNVAFTPDIGGKSIVCAYDSGIITIQTAQFQTNFFEEGNVMYEQPM